MRSGKVSFVAAVVVLLLLAVGGLVSVANIQEEPIAVQRFLTTEDSSIRIVLDPTPSVLIVMAKAPGEPWKQGDPVLTLTDSSDFRDIRNLRWTKDLDGTDLAAVDYLQLDGKWGTASFIPGKKWYSTYSPKFRPENMHHLP